MDRQHTPAGWYPVVNSYGQSLWRYWDGNTWTSHTSSRVASRPTARLTNTFVYRNRELLSIVAILTALVMVVVPVVLFSRWRDQQKQDAWIAAFEDGYGDACENILPSNVDVFTGPVSDQVVRDGWCEASMPRVFPEDLAEDPLLTLFTTASTPAGGYERGYQVAAATIVRNNPDQSVCYEQYQPETCYTADQLLKDAGIPAL